MRRAIACALVLLSAAALPAAADEPRVDLLTNRHRWHLHRDGIVIPAAGEGFRKYDITYSTPWGPVVEAEGRRGRTLGKRQAELHFPWTAGGGAARVRLRVLGGVRRQRVAVNINRKHVGAAFIEDGWRVLDFEVPAGLLRDGENRLLLSIDRRSTIGGHRTYGLLHSIEIAPGAPSDPKDAPWPAASPVAEAGGEPALAGFRVYALYQEIPRTATLRVRTMNTGPSPARFRVAVRPVGGPEAILLDVEQASGEARDHAVSLETFADRLVRLELRVDGADPSRAAWLAPRIELAPAPLRPARAPFRNAILWVGDALRSDRLKLYGETRVRTPRITAAGEAYGVVFLNNQAASPSSPPSHASIQTGMIPRVHGVVGDSAKLDPGTPMISTQLGQAGVATAYYGNNPFGMARLEEPGRWTAFHQPVKEGQGSDCTALVDLMLGFARERHAKGERFFISALAYEPHTPYRYHEGITEHYFPGPFDPIIGKSPDGHLFGGIVSGKLKMTDARWAQLKGLYDGEVEYMDACFGTLLDGLKAMGAFDDTLVVLTSDHGEGFFEHGRLGHAFGHFAELADVPLVLLGPGLVERGIRIDTVTSHLDIAPTLLDLMGVKPHPAIQGRSLAPLVRRQGPRPPRVMPLEYGRSYALRARRWKYIVDYAGTESLYDLQTDPTEQKDLVEATPLPLRYMRDLTGFYLVHRRAWRAATWGPFNDHRQGFLDHLATD